MPRVIFANWSLAAAPCLLGELLQLLVSNQAVLWFSPLQER
jgi:hypothetical protein